MSNFRFNLQQAIQIVMITIRTTIFFAQKKSRYGFKKSIVNRMGDEWLGLDDLFMYFFLTTLTVLGTSDPIIGILRIVLGMVGFSLAEPNVFLVFVEWLPWILIFNEALRTLNGKWNPSTEYNPVSRWILMAIRGFFI